MASKISGAVLCSVLLALFSLCEANPAYRNNIRDTPPPEKKTILLPNGETCAFVELGIKQKDTASLLLIHGNNSSSLFYIPLFRRLTGVHIIAPDLRGFGDSSYNSDYCSFAELAQDIKFLADALEITKVHVAAWSLGSGPAYELALKYPEFVSSLFIIQGMSHRGLPAVFQSDLEPYANKSDMAANAVIQNQVYNLETKNRSYFETLWNNTVYIVRKPGRADSNVYITENLKMRCLADAYWAMANFNISVFHNGYAEGTGAVGDILCPVTLTRADKDLMIPPVIINDVNTAIPHSKVLNYSNCGHSLMVDMPDKLASDILVHMNTVQ